MAPITRLTNISPSSHFVRGLQAILRYWLDRTSNLVDAAVSQLNSDFTNLLRIVEMSIVLPELRLDAATLILQCFFWIEGAGHVQQWQPVLIKLITLLPTDEVALRFRLLKQLGQFQRSQNHLNDALETFGQATKLASQLSDPVQLADICVNCASLFLLWRQYEAAEREGQKALNLCGDKNLRLRAVILETLGVIAQEQGHLVLAEHRLREALIFQKQVGITLNIARTMKALAITFHAQQNYIVALQLLAEVEDMLADNHHIRDCIEVYINRGTIYYDLNELTEAELAFRQAENLAETQSGFFITKGMIANNLGCVGRDQEKWLAAEFYFEQSLGFYQQAGDILLEANVIGNMAKMYQQRKLYAEAMDQFVNAVTLLEQFPDNSWARKLYDDYSARNRELSRLLHGL